MGKLRVLHYLNQFFAGIGGEEKADLPPQVVDGPVGPGKVLQRLLGDDWEVVATAYCGDNYINERQDEALDTILGYVQYHKPDLVVVGPSFNAGRYGLASGLICSTIQERMGIPCVTGMSVDNPAVEMHRATTYIVPTTTSASGMEASLRKMVVLAEKLVQGKTLGPANQEGYIPRGIRFTEVVSDSIGERSVEMLLAQLRGEDFQTEWPVPQYSESTPAKPLDDLKTSTIALITTGGIVHKGNPHRLESARATKWLKYDTSELHAFTSQQWESIHGGFDTTNVNKDPNRVLPMDVLKELEDQGAIGRLYESVYVTTGNQAGLDTAGQFGREIGKELVADNVDGVLLVAT